MNFITAWNLTGIMETWYKTFLTNNGFLENAEIVLTEKDKIVTEEQELVKIFNDQDINIVEYSCGTKPTNVAKAKEIEDNKKAV